MKILSGVYILKNTVTGKGYIGSSVNLKRRHRTHLCHLRAGTHHSEKLQRSWAKHGESAFTFEVLELLPAAESDLRAAEQRWMDLIGSVAHGYNVCPQAGNVGRLPKTPEHKARIGNARRGAKHSAETRARLSQLASARSGRKMTDEQKQRISAANRGKIRTPEQRAALSQARTGLKVAPMTAAHREAIAAAKRGKPLSELHKQRIREGRRARNSGAQHAH